MFHTRPRFVAGYVLMGTGGMLTFMPGAGPREFMFWCFGVWIGWIVGVGFILNYISRPYIYFQKSYIFLIISGISLTNMIVSTILRQMRQGLCHHLCLDRLGRTTVHSGLDSPGGPNYTSLTLLIAKCAVLINSVSETCYGRTTFHSGAWA